MQAVVGLKHRNLLNVRLWALKPNPEGDLVVKNENVVEGIVEMKVLAV